MNKKLQTFWLYLFISALMVQGCNLFEPFSQAFDEDEKEVELFEADEALHLGNYSDALERWRNLVAGKPTNTEYRVKYGESILGSLGINFFTILETLDKSTSAGQTTSILSIVPIKKDLVRMNEALELIDDGPRSGDKGNAGFGYGLMAGAKLLDTFDTNSNRAIDTGEVLDPTLWTSSTDYDKDGKSDQNGKTMGKQMESDLLNSLNYLAMAIAVKINHVDAIATTDQNGLAIYIQKEFVDAYNAIRVTYTKVVDVNNKIANQALSGTALAAAIEALDN